MEYVQRNDEINMGVKKEKIPAGAGDVSFIQNVQACCGALIAFYLMGTGFLLRM
jgi:hypothetical protein